MFLFWCQGFIAFVISALVFVALALLGVPVHIVCHKFLSLVVTSIVFSFILALFLYSKSLRADSTALADGGNTGQYVFICYLYAAIISVLMQIY